MEPENLGLEMSKAFAGEAGKESVNKLASAIHGLFPFWGLKAKAIDVYVREIENSGLSPEAKMFAIANAKKSCREIKNQSAIIDVAYSAVCGEPDNSQNDPVDLDDELILRLLDARKFVSDEELQLLWGNVLAGELENPESTPKYIVRILSELSKENAVIFSNLCSLQVSLFADSGSQLWLLGPSFMILQEDAFYLKQLNINSTKLRELEHLGLIDYASIGTYNKTIQSSFFPYIHIVCGNKVITTYTKDDSFNCGTVILTAAGSRIANFVPNQYNSQHMDTIVKKLQENYINISPVPGLAVIKTPETPGKYMEYSFQRQWTSPSQTPESR